MEYEYLVIDESDAYHTSVSKYKTKEAMLEGIQHCDIDKIQVYAICGQIKLVKRPSIVEA